MPKNMKMPVLFVGHGSPMNAIEVNEFTIGWNNIAKIIPRPKAILVISAHFETAGTVVTAMDNPRTIHDFGGFPKALFDFQYPAKGSPELAQRIIELIPNTQLDYEWGLDHGAWSVLTHLFPVADIPVVQLSMDYRLSPQEHYELARKLQPLRDEGVLIIGAGNMIHNFDEMELTLGFNHEFGHEWANKANAEFKDLIFSNNMDPLLNFHNNSNFRLAAPTPEHYLPMIYTLAQRNEDDKVKFFNDKIVAGSFSMTSFIISL
jgi:4,5-DOPA dioxygenase extradiol